VEFGTFVHRLASENPDSQEEVKFGGFRRLASQECGFGRVTLCVGFLAFVGGWITVCGGLIRLRGGLVTVGGGVGFFGTMILREGGDLTARQGAI
jgi:hypothetical protein